MDFDHAVEDALTTEVVISNVVGEAPVPSVCGVRIARREDVVRHEQWGVVVALRALTRRRVVGERGRSTA